MSSRHTDLYQSAGDLRVDYIQIVSSAGELFDVSQGGWTKLSLFESIYEPFLKGEIHMHDTTNLPQTLRLMGNELIRFRFSTPGLDPIVFSGRLTKVSERVETGDTSAAYKFEFVSSELISSLQKKVRKSYINKSYSDIVALVYDEFLREPNSPLGLSKTLAVSPTLGLKSIAIPGWGPFKVIKRLASKSISVNPNYDNATYMFFERCDNGHPADRGSGRSGFIFKSLESLWDPSINKPAQSYTYEWKNIEANEGASFTKVNDMAEIARTDMLENIAGGMYASKLVTHDLVKRKKFTQTFNYIDEYYKHTNMYPNQTTKGSTTALTNSLTATQAPESSEVYAPRHYQSYDSSEDSFGGDRVLNRVSVMQALTSQTIKIEVPGDSERRVGEIVEFNMPSPETVGKDGPSLDEHSGKWMIASITHNAIRNPKDYNMVLELSRNSYPLGLPAQTTKIDPTPLPQRPDPATNISLPGGRTKL